MEQHPIPQQISSYEFKLVGEMTLKQFLKAISGIILAVIINTTKLIVIIKWPLMLTLAGTGLALAFVPFEDRPLETWIISFFKSIYSPTVYTYKKKANKNWLDIDLTKISTSTSNKDDSEISDEEVKGTQKHIKLKDYFQTGVKTKKKKEEIKLDEVNDEEVEKVEKKETLEKGKEEIIKKEDVVVERKIERNEWKDNKTKLGLKSEKLEATGKAVFGSIPMPDMPDVANVVVGMTTTGEGKILDGVIVEIQDEKGNPSRVLKTNSLGQFKISTPLASGRYLIIAEKKDYIFDRVNLDLTGKIIEPIKIIAHN